ncbi:MAG TPA: heme o synthase [Opitutaceae bacterium]
MATRQIAPSPAVAASASRPEESLASTLLALTKPRLALFSIFSGMAGYAVTAKDAGAAEAVVVLAGLALSAGGALSFNQWWERDTDRRMRRTARRPLPRGAISVGAALTWSLALSGAGVGLFLGRGLPVAAVLATATIVIYGLVYTPLKRRTRWATEVGSISGALPPLIGAASAGDPGAGPAWLLAGILLLWQMPHFFAIGWMYRDDYRAAGFPLRPAVDPTGADTARWSLLYTLVLFVGSLAPWMLGRVGAIYGATALLGGLGLLATAVRFLASAGMRDRRARDLFLASILYLPPVMAALVADQWR